MGCSSTWARGSCATFSRIGCATWRCPSRSACATLWSSAPPPASGPPNDAISGWMFSRVLCITLNTYREAVRARLLLGVFALGLATCLYSSVVATLSLHNEARVVGDLGAASLSLYGVVVAIVLGSTSLYRELEYKTIFPILSRPIRRWEYLLGKYLGTLLTVAVFVAVHAAPIRSIPSVATD